MQFLLCSTGTLGDLTPFLALGTQLRARGHRVAVATSESYRAWVESRGLEFVPVVGRHIHDSTLANPDLWIPSSSFVTLARGFIFPPLTALPRWLESQPDPRKWTLVSNFCSGPAARLTQEAIGVDMFSLWTNPAALCSRTAPPVIVGMEYLPRMDALYQKTMGKVVFDALDQQLEPAVRDARAEWGLPPVSGVLGWAISPQGSLALFPDWYGDKAPDWPENLEFVGFSLAETALELPLEVEAFLQAGEAPAVVTFGTGMQHASAQFDMAVAACRKLNLRVLVVTPDSAGLNLPLDENCLRTGYLPFERLLSRARLLIHHGGVGTSARALASGVRQLVIPLAHDQPDNAARLVELGVAGQVFRRNLKVEALVEQLESLLTDETSARCLHWARTLEADGDGIQKACLYLERKAGRA